jgi:hypothetical protein
MPPSTLQDAISKIQTRVDELAPAVQEHTELVSALEKLQPNGPAPRKPRGRRPRGVTRAAQAVQQISDNPGVTTAALAERMGVSANYLYRILPKTQGIRKKGKGWHPA